MSVFVVVFVPSSCWVIDVVLDLPLGSVADVVLVCFDGSFVSVALFFCPFGICVVVVLEFDCANAAPPAARLRPMIVAAIFDVERMVFLRMVWMVSTDQGGTTKSRSPAMLSPSTKA